MKSSVPSFALSVFVLAGLALHCSSSDDSSSGGGSGTGGTNGGGSTSAGGKGGSSAGSGGKADTGGSSAHAGSGSGGEAASGTGGAVNEGGEGGTAGASGELTTPVIGALKDLAVVQNTIATPKQHISFTVTDPGGVNGLTASATSANADLATTSAVICTDGTCTFDVTLTPTTDATFSIGVEVDNPRGGSATSQFSIAIAPLTVTKGTDSGTGSLRATVAAAAAGDVVVFDPSVTQVSLTSELDFTRAITVAGPGSNSLQIDCGKVAQCFSTSADPVSISGMLVMNANVAIAALSGHLLVKSLAVGQNAYGLNISASASGPTVVDAVSCTFSGNTTNGVTITSTTSPATGNFIGCTASANAVGFAISTAAAGQTVQLNLSEGNQVQNNTQAGIVVEMDGGLGSAMLDMSPPASSVANDISMNKVGVLRSGAVPSSALTIVPATQVASNTTNFSPAWP